MRIMRTRTFSTRFPAVILSAVVSKVSPLKSNTNIDSKLVAPELGGLVRLMQNYSKADEGCPLKSQISQLHSF
jgi:hypothetical protein